MASGILEKIVGTNAVMTWWSSLIRLRNAAVSLPRPIRYLLAWILAAVIAAVCFWNSWTKYDNPKRGDGNDGHMAIDFGGQYLLGRMLVHGQGQHLYNRNFQRPLLQEVYLKESEDPDQETSDVEQLMGWLMGKDHPQEFGSLVLPFASSGNLETAVLVTCGHDYWRENQLKEAMNPRGGPLYPPIISLFYFPFGFLPPQPAYRLNQCLNLVFAVLAGLAVPFLSRGRIWWPVAVAMILLFPGLSGSMSLGQNSALTLCILMWGWALIAADKQSNHGEYGEHGEAKTSNPQCFALIPRVPRGFISYSVLGGLVWGLLAFKPTWALAFFLVPFLSRRWRVCFAMLGTGIALAAATLPFVGWHSWIDWFSIGKEAARVFQYDENWIDLSRDLLSIPLRWLDFETSAEERLNNQTLAWIGWGILLSSVTMTLLVAFWARKQMRALTGPAAAFLFLGAWLSCFHFMYYDVLLAAPAVFLLLIETKQLVRRNPGVTKLGYALQLLGFVLISVIFITPLLLETSLPRLPYDTFCLMALWLWCGWYLLRGSKVPCGMRCTEE